MRGIGIQEDHTNHRNTKRYVQRSRTETVISKMTNILGKPLNKVDKNINWYCCLRCFMPISRVIGIQNSGKKNANIQNSGKKNANIGTMVNSLPSLGFHCSFIAIHL